MAISLEQLRLILQHQQKLLALQQQLLSTLFTRPENKKSVYDAVTDISEAYLVEGSNPFIPESERNICNVSGSQQENPVLNAHKVVAIRDYQEPDPVDEARSPELNEALLVLSSSENNFQLEQIYGPRDISQESYGDSYSENNCSDTTNPIIPNVTQNHCETETYIESAYPISNDNVSDMGSQNNACYFDEISHKNQENISAESNYGQKSHLILLDDNFRNDPLSTDEIPNGFESNASEELNFDLKSKVVHYHLVVSSGSDIQCDKRRLNKVLLFVTWRYKDPTLFRGGGECWRIKSYAYLFLRKIKTPGTDMSVSVQGKSDNSSLPRRWTNRKHKSVTQLQLDPSTRSYESAQRGGVSGT
ncbi:unnamed protein product [Schistosoma guineensis]|nr:unnamed protein product [Schistosoma guineensis]